MRALLAIVVLVSLTAAGHARAGNDSAPAVNAELLKQMQDTQVKRETAAEVAPDSTPPPTVESLLARGDGDRAKGEHARALWSYLLAHKLDHKDPRPLERIGTLHLSREPERAEAIFRQLLSSDGESAVACTGLGLALIARGAWSDAVVELRRSVDLDDSLAATHNALGVALDHLKQTEAARWHYVRASELQPGSYEPYNNLGVSRLTSGDYEGAVEAFEQASRLQEKDAAVWNNLGVARGRLRDYDGALDAFRKAGDELSAWNNVGYVRYLNGDYEGALVAYEHALHAAGDPQERLPVLRNARAAEFAKDHPAPPKAQAAAPAPAPASGSDAPGLGEARGLLVEDVAPPAAPAESASEEPAPAETPSAEVAPPASPAEAAAPMADPSAAAAPPEGTPAPVAATTASAPPVEPTVSAEAISGAQ